LRYILDVNALLAWEHPSSPHHEAFHRWAKEVGSYNLWTCALAELGFLRVSMQVFSYSLSQSADALDSIKSSAGGFIDTAPSPRLPSWASTPSRTSDGYLVQLAQENGLKLATFDSGIRGSLVEVIGKPLQ
jgi:predicted nucleic acid-binding protein